jgi:drug/metabolite transporter (DMT)-like permease
MGSLNQRNILAVVLWMAGALFSFSATAVAVRALSGSLNDFEMLAFRNIAGVLILLGAALVRPEFRRWLRPRRMKLHLLRNVVHFAATAAWTFGVTLLPLATVFALEFTTPAWVALLAVLILSERMDAARLTAIVLGFVGVLVILRPGVATLQPASFVVLAAAVGFALTAIVTKKLVATESTFAILLFMNLIQLVLNLAGAEWGFWLKLGVSQILPVLGIAIGGLLSHLCLTNAYRHGDAIMVVPLDFLRIPLIALVGWRLYGEPLNPFVLVGSLIIIAGILWNLRSEARVNARARAA